MPSGRVSCVKARPPRTEEKTVEDSEQEELLIAFVTSSKALVTSSDALVSNSFLFLIAFGY